jgi:hypothetical protein
MNPRGPILRPQDRNLPIVIGLDVRPWFRRQHREGRGLVALALAPQARDRQERRVLQGEPVLGLRVFLAREFEKRAGRDKTAIAVRKTPALRAEIEDRAALGLAGGNPKRIGVSSIAFPAARITGPMSPIFMSSAVGRSSSLCCVGILSSRYCMSSQYSAQAMCCS